ncbi:hypothetical protein CAT7_06036 [Carnobacterium sp. AT7]|nr:hypothetical protein CAT7_06036 [Carnobacterium sp. AT7]
MKKGSGKDNRKVYHTLTNFDELNHVIGADMTFKK